MCRVPPAGGRRTGLRKPSPSRGSLVCLLLALRAGLAPLNTAPWRAQADAPDGPAVNSPARPLSDRVVVESIRAGKETVGANPEFGRAVRRFDEVGGQFVFAADGRITGADLAVGRMSVSDTEILLLRHVPPLATLKVAGGTITNRSLAGIMAHPQLRLLALGNVQIDGNGLAQLASLARLESLRIQQAPRLTDDDLACLPRFPALRYLELIDNNFTDRGMSTVAELANLRLLDIRGCADITDEGICRLAPLTSLVALRIGSPSIGDASMAAVARFPRLTRLTIEHAAVTDAGLAQIAALPLAELGLMSCAGITNDGLKSVALLSQLKTLDCRDMFFTAGGLAALGHLEQLRTLRLNQLIGLGNSGLAGLKEMKQLVRLELEETQVPAACLAFVARLTALQHLNVANAGIGDDGIRHLAALEDLQTLDLHGNGDITDRAVDVLAGLERLRQLNLRGTSITPAGSARLHETLQHCAIEPPGAKR